LNLDSVILQLIKQFLSDITKSKLHTGHCMYDPLCYKVSDPRGAGIKYPQERDKMPCLLRRKS